MPAQEGGLKGFFTRAGASFYSGGLFVKEKSWMVAQMAGKVGFVVATTSIAVLMPLIFEIMREGQVRALVTLIRMYLAWRLLTHPLLLCEPSFYHMWSTSADSIAIKMIEADKLQVKELRSQGYSDGQLQEMGFPKIALGLAPAVLKY